MFDATTKEELIAEIDTAMNNDEIESTLTAEDIVHHAYMLTQYETYGEVGTEDLDKYLVEEIMDEPTVEEINEYLSNNGYEMYYPLEDSELDEFFYGSNPSDIIRQVVYGSFNYYDEYFTYNGYGNLESCNESEIIDDYGKDTKEYMLRNGNVPYGSEAEDIATNADIILAAAHHLVSIGY